ncbi:MAG: MFS transporter [Candidatus Bathyarchaeia archaeon]|jgi:EmrB/QacA subfamily drug resistance transporter
MVQYKWVALSNTTLGTLMASIDLNIVLIALPAIFRGINIDPFSSFQYLLWMMFGYSIVTATLLVTFGRLSDIFGRVRLYNLGFAIFTVGSILLFVTPNTGDLGAIELIVFRIIQGIGAAFLFSNSAAILTDAFPENERGKALGINQLSFLVGSLVGLVLGGILAVYDWRLVFLVSVPVGIVGTIWSYLKLKEQHVAKSNQSIDLWGNVTFGAGLILLLLGITYGLTPYGDSPMGWTNPWVIFSLVAGAALLIAFPFIEKHVKDPMFRLDLFKIRSFSAGNLATFLSSMSRGGVMIMLIVLLQGIWLPLHGFSYEDAPFWAGIYMIPMTLGVALTGPISGWLSDKHGARTFATVGMIITGLTFLAFLMLPANFDYLPFALILFTMGLGNGIFMSPNMASIMNSVPAEHRGAASGMRSTLQNCGQTISQAIFFSIIIISLNATLPAALSSAALNVGASQQVADVFASTPASGALFAAFLGYNPIGTLLQSLGSAVTSALPQSVISVLTGQAFFPNAIEAPFMSALSYAFLFAAVLCFLAAACSALSGKKYVYKDTTAPALVEENKASSA